MICANARQSELEKMGASALSKLVIAQISRIEHLELQLAKLQRQQFGQKSEKMPHNADQLPLGLDTSVIEPQPVVASQSAEQHKTTPTKNNRKPRAIPAHLRREVRTHLPADSKCPCCKGELLAKALSLIARSWRAGLAKPQRCLHR